MNEEKIILKVITLGDSNVGKTSLFYHYVNGKFIYHRSCSIDFFSKELMIENQQVSVMVWDTFGQERFHSLGFAYYRGAHCITLCFDIHKEESFNNLEKWLDEIKTYGSGNVPFVLVGTKKDIPRTDKSISKERIEQWCKNIEDQGIIDNVHYFETSAKLSQNITEPYNAAAKLALEHYNKTINLPISTHVIVSLEEVKPGYCC
ncbi:hypothetical protein ACTFIY_001048 [Dictyostelium cf. discoideum]